MKVFKFILFISFTNSVLFSQFKTSDNTFSYVNELAKSGPKKTMKEHIHAAISFQYGVFNSSVPQFDSVFGSSSVKLVGMSADFNVWDNLNVELKYRSFGIPKMSKSFQSSPDGGITIVTDDIKASWEQSWALIGAKYFYKPNGNIYPYLFAGLGYVGATSYYEKKSKTVDGTITETPYPQRTKTYSTYFGIGVDGGIRYVLPDEGLAFFVNGEFIYATGSAFIFDANSTQQPQDVNIGGIGFTTGFSYIL